MVLEGLVSSLSSFIDGYVHRSSFNVFFFFLYVAGGCKTTAAGAEYSGTLSTTSSGRTCQKWDTGTPHSHDKFPSHFVGGVFPANFCRNPDNDSKGPWCFTTDPNKEWEYCDVPMCRPT